MFTLDLEPTLSISYRRTRVRDEQIQLMDLVLAQQCTDLTKQQQQLTWKRTRTHQNLPQLLSPFGTEVLSYKH